MLRRVRHVHQDDPTEVHVHGRVTERVPPGLQELRPDHPWWPRRLLVHAAHRKLLQAPLHAGPHG